MDKRIVILKRMIHLKPMKNGHLKVNVERCNGMSLIVPTSITSDLTRFEQQCVVVHIYKIMERSLNKQDARVQIRNLNYAQIFGSPWNLEKK